MSALSSVRSQNSMTCFACRDPTNLFSFPCSHKFCADCIISNIYSNLKSFSLLLNEDINSLSNKFSYLGCPANCPCSKQSLSKIQLFKILETSRNLDMEKKKEFYRLLKLGSSFFFGIKTHFYKCAKCSKIRGYIGKKPLVCGKCICTLYNEQTGIKAKDAIFEWVISEENFVLKNDLIKDYILVKCVKRDQPGSNSKCEYTYECHLLHNGECFVELAQTSNEDFKVVLLRAIVIDRTDNNIIVEDWENTVQFVSIVKLVIN